MKFTPSSSSIPINRMLVPWLIFHSLLLFAFIPAGTLTTTAFAPNITHKKILPTTPLYAGNSKTIAIFGASGLTSSECIFQALQNGHEVIGLTRNPSNLVQPAGSAGSSAGQPFPISDRGPLTVLAGSVTNYSNVQQVFQTAQERGKKIDGVIVSLGGKTKDVGDTMLTDGTKNIIQAMKEYGVKRLAVVTSIGTGDSKDQAPFFFKVLMATVMKKIFNDKNNQELEVRKSGLEYCIVRPGGLTVEPPTGVIHVIQGEAGSIARADVATFCLSAVTEEDFPYIGQAPCISSVGGTSWVKDRSKAARGEM